MNLFQKILLFIVLPTITPLLYPPQTLAAGLPVIAVGILIFVILGILLMRGRSMALTLTIFIQGVNVIVRLMMFLPHAQTASGQLDWIYILTNILSIALSTYILLRLDRVDVRKQMIA